MSDDQDGCEWVSFFWYQPTRVVPDQRPLNGCVCVCYLLRFLSFPLIIDLLRFQARCRKRWLNLDLVFLCLFCAAVNFFWWMNVWFCCVGFSFFHTKPRDWLGEMSPKGPILCRVGRKTTTQSINLLRMNNNTDLWKLVVLRQSAFRINIFHLI